MAFTDRSDIYLAINEAGVNRAIWQVMRQRPSLFNYATAHVIAQRSLWCRAIDAHPVVIARGNPLFTEVPAVPVLATGSGYALDAIAQLGAAMVDFSPINTLQPPAELGQLPGNSFAAMGELSAGLGCPSELPGPVPVPGPRPGALSGPGALPGRAALAGAATLPGPGTLTGLTPTGAAPVVPWPGTMNCFTLKAFGFGTASFVGQPGNEHIQGRLLGFDTVDISPQALEDAIDCYASLVIKLGILPQLAIPTIRFTRDLLQLVHLVIEPSLALPHNPAIEDDQLKVYLKATVTGLPPPPPGPASPEHGGGVVRARTRTGPFDLIGAVSRAVVVQVFQQLLAGYEADKSGSTSLGPLTVSYHARAHATSGTIDLKDDGTVAVKDLGIVWDTLELCLGIDIPEICIGGFCIIPTPFGCALRAPKLCVFSASPDLQFCLELGGFLHSKLSLAVRPSTRYRVDPGRTAGMNDWDAQDAGVPNLWQVIAVPVSVDFELIDLTATVGDLFEQAVNAAIDGLLGPLPGWAKDLIHAILGPVIDLVRGLLGIGDDIEQWLIDLIGNHLGLFNWILQLMSDYLGKHPLAELPDPFPVLDAEPSKIAVMLPIDYLGVQTSAAELVVNADLGGAP